MKILLTLLALVLSSSVIAQDISDYEIEGINVGDSLLDFLSVTEIQKYTKHNYYPGSDKRFLTVEFYKGDTEIIKKYDALQIIFKNNDKNFIIYGLTAAYFLENMSQCIEETNQIIKGLEISIKDYEKIEIDFIHPRDTSGESIVKGYDYNLSLYDYIQVACYDWSDEMQYSDNLRIEISHSEFTIWRDDYYYGEN